MSYIFNVHSPQNKNKIFEGPLDLLLELIEKEKLDITDVSLAQVAEQFLWYIKNDNSIALKNLADFLLVASKLMLIKSKVILPALDLNKDEEEDIEELKKRLSEYKKFKDIAKEIGKLENKKNKLFSRQGYLNISAMFCPPKKISAFDLKNTFEKILCRAYYEKKEIIEDKVVSINDKIEHIIQILFKRIKLTFNDATSEAKSKIEIIVTFLALLELIKRSFIIVEQNEDFGTIIIKKVN